MTGTGDSGPGPAHRLPEPGWLPDPGRTDVERYWNGWNWTDQTRDRYTRVPHSSAATATASRASDAATRNAAGSRRIGRLVATLGIMTMVGLGVAAYQGLLPSWVEDKVEQAVGTPSGAEVGYPVFGSDDTVTYLARGLVAQQESIDVTWLQASGKDVVSVVDDAMSEALSQNPYAYASGWRIRIEFARARVFPEYTYPPEEAERRRVATASAVAAILSDPTLDTSADVATTVGALHDAVVRASSYDHGAADEIAAGERPETSATVARSQEAYGALVEGTAVCNGYAQAFQLLAQASGITSVIVTGEATSGVTTGDHAWNLVQVDDAWLVVDTTWDDADDALPRRDYVLMDPSDPRLAMRSANTYWVVDANAAKFGPSWG